MSQPAEKGNPTAATASPQRRPAVVARWAVVSTLLSEAVTVAMRIGTGTSAAEFNRTAPLLLQIHHMFWSVPLALIAAVAWRRRRLSGALLGIGLGLVASDLLHHFVVLPLTVGNTGWHWP